jgi:hypothetical protein
LRAHISIVAGHCHGKKEVDWADEQREAVVLSKAWDRPAYEKIPYYRDQCDGSPKALFPPGNHHPGDQASQRKQGEEDGWAGRLTRKDLEPNKEQEGDAKNNDDDAPNPGNPTANICEGKVCVHGKPPRETDGILTVFKGGIDVERVLCLMKQLRDRCNNSIQTFYL